MTTVSMLQGLGSFLPRTKNGNKPGTTKHHADEKAEPESYMPRS